MSSPVSPRRLAALCRKETLQVIRDPSSILVAFVLPLVMMLIFGYGINLDSSVLPVGVVLRDGSPEARAVMAGLAGSPHIRVVPGRTEAEMKVAVTRGEIRGYVVVPADFSRRLHHPGAGAEALLVTDGSDPNTASFLENSVEGAMQVGHGQRAADRGRDAVVPIDLQARFWMNPAAESRNYIIPGSIVVIMTVIGALLTSLVVAREWERGTMEALLASPVTKAEFLLGKFIPYYGLGIASLLLCVGFAAVGMGVPFRGSVPALLLLGSLFLSSALGLGLLLSTLTRNQFNAAQIALNAAFLPALMLSGFVFELRSTPALVQAVSYLIPARYFVTAIQTLFQAGDIWAVLMPNLGFLFGAGVLFLGLTALKTRRTLE